MRTIRTIIIAAAALAFAGASAPAFADNPPAAGAATPQTYAFVDMVRIMRETTAAKAVNDELMKKKQSFKADLDKKAQALRSEQEALSKQRDTMKKEDLVAKARSVEERGEALNKEAGERRQAFDFVVTQSMAKVRDLAGDSIETVAQEHKYAAVFSREAVIIGAKNLDITDEVIKNMNASGKKVTVDWSAKPKKSGDGQ
jgi:Skp family chaperone for outer membrane proteins